MNSSVLQSYISTIKDLLEMNSSDSSSVVSFNVSDQDLYFKKMVKFRETVLNTYAIMEFCLMPFIIVANVVLIASIINDDNLRKIFRYRVMFSIAVADLLIGLISCPVRGEVTLNGFFSHSCSTYVLVSLLDMYVQIFVAMWGIVSVNMDCLLTLYKVQLPTLPPRQQKLVVGLILTLPWVAMFIIMLPVAYAYGTLSFDRSKYQCYLLLPEVAKHIVVLFTYIIPGLIITCQSIITSAVIICRKHMTSSLMTSPRTDPPSWIYVIAGMLTVVMLGIEQCTHLTKKAIFDSLDYASTFVLIYTVIWISDAKSAVTPLVWFVFPELRVAVIKLMNRLPWRRVDDVVNGMNDTIVAYRDLSHEEDI